MLQNYTKSTIVLYLHRPLPTLLPPLLRHNHCHQTHSSATTTTITQLYYCHRLSITTIIQHRHCSYNHHWFITTPLLPTDHHQLSITEYCHHPSTSNTTTVMSSLPPYSTQTAPVIYLLEAVFEQGTVPFLADLLGETSLLESGQIGKLLNSILLFLVHVEQLDLSSALKFSPSAPQVFAFHHKRICDIH